MPYTPPPGNAVDFQFGAGYTPPAGSALDFEFGDDPADDVPLFTMMMSLFMGE